jgi:Fic-DOC domain mobile mystery protein B
MTMTTGETQACQTPIDPDEGAGLLLRIRTREALNRAEEENIVRARFWATSSRVVRQNLLTDTALKRVHREMFGGVWKWAGHYRVSDKNLGGPWHQIPTAVRQLCDNFAFRVSLESEDGDRLAADFHHQLVSIHPFPNGNGRHARFCADRLVENLGSKAFAWGRDDLGAKGEARDRYLAALRAADSGQLEALLAFARSGGPLERDEGEGVL